jgi:hypothetical protein
MTTDIVPINRGQRTLKCTPDLLVKARDYLDHYGREDFGDAIPTMAGLSRHVGVSRKTLYAWKIDERTEEMAVIMEQLIARQEQVLVNKGLLGEFNSTMAKLMLSNNHGYSEKSGMEVSFNVNIGEKDAAGL